MTEEVVEEVTRKKSKGKKERKSKGDKKSKSKRTQQKEDVEAAPVEDTTGLLGFELEPKVVETVTTSFKTLAEDENLKMVSHSIIVFI